MIARKERLETPDAGKYAPRRYHSETDRWIPLQLLEQTFDDPLDAARECLEYLCSNWAELDHAVRVMRALCEHPEFDFDNDTMTSEMIRKQARDVAARLAAMDMDFRHLLDIYGESSLEPDHDTEPGAVPEPVEDDKVHRTETAPVEPVEDDEVHRAKTALGEPDPDE